MEDDSLVLASLQQQLQEQTERAEQAERQSASLADEVLALRAAMEWKPIETAPKDGARIILASIKPCFFDCAPGYWLIDRNYWRNWMNCEPTHWRPVGELPK